MKTFVLAALLGVSAVAQQPKAPKPPVGVPEDAKLFNGKWYRVYIEDVKTWARAKERAASKGAQLVCIPNEETQNFVASIAEQRTLWIGATKNSESLWHWVDGTAVKFTAWAPSQPDETKGEDWVVIHRGKWHDNNGKGGVPIVGFICEWKAK
jgi:Lectin C-type domain